MYIITVALQKGGVGKTAVCVNLAATFASHLGFKAAVADFDTQCNGTRMLMPEDPERTLFDLLVSADLEIDMDEVWVQLFHPHLHLLPGDPRLGELARRITEKQKFDEGIMRVGEILSLTAPPDLDFLFIDTPPSRDDFFTKAALAAADSVLSVVAVDDAQSIDGLGAHEKLIAEIQERYNPELRREGIILNRSLPHRRTQSAMQEATLEIYGDLVLKPSLPRREAANVAALEARPLESLPRGELGEGGLELLLAYRELAENLAHRVKARPAAGHRENVR